LRLLGSVGEPINPEAWLWYHRVVGEGRCPIVDTWWQTETGGILITPLPGATALKPGQRRDLSLALSPCWSMPTAMSWRCRLGQFMHHR
jgi:acetyl-CoA synthetase